MSNRNRTTMLGSRDRTSGTGHLGQVSLDRGLIGQPGQDREVGRPGHYRKERITGDRRAGAGKWHLRQYIHDRTAVTGQSERIVEIIQPEEEKMDSTARLDSKDRTVRRGQPGRDDCGRSPMTGQSEKDI